jgi:predicted anti-sigma-YlaC factor YlaD
MKGTLSCKEIYRKLNAYLDKELPAKEEKHITGHLLTCKSCRREFDSLQKLNTLLGERQTETISHSLLQKLEDIPAREGKISGINKAFGRFSLFPAAAAVLLTLFSALLLGRTYLSTGRYESTTTDSYQIAQESFYTLWEEIVNE